MCKGGHRKEWTWASVDMCKGRNGGKDATWVTVKIDRVVNMGKVVVHF